MDLRPLTCPITHALYLDPVNAPDGNTYERAALEEYALGDHKKRKAAALAASPLNPAVKIGPLDRLLPNRKVRELVENAVRDNPKDPLAKEWLASRRVRELQLAEELWGEGRVEEAAKLGHAEAVAEMRARQRVSDAADLVARAKATFRADPADVAYRRLLREAVALDSPEALLMLGIAYAEGRGGEVRPGKALECFMHSSVVQALR